MSYHLTDVYETAYVCSAKNIDTSKTETIHQLINSPFLPCFSVLGHVWLFATPWTATLGFPVFHYLPEFAQTHFESVMPSNRLILCHPLFFLPSIFHSIGVFSNEWALHIMWPMYWSFSFSISTSDEYSGLISFKMDWLDLHAVQGTQESSSVPQSVRDYWKNHSFD